MAANSEPARIQLRRPSLKSVEESQQNCTSTNDHSPINKQVLNTQKLMDVLKLVTKMKQRRHD